jgi:adenylate cyclase
MIPTDKWGQFLVNYRGGRSTFPSYSVHRVISDKPEEKPPRKNFQGKIVLIGATAIGIYDARITPFAPEITPFAPEVPGVEIHATVIDNILNRDFIRRPDWIWTINIPFIIFMALIPALLLSTLPAIRGAFISMGFFLIYALTNWYFLDGLSVHYRGKGEE